MEVRWEKHLLSENIDMKKEMEKRKKELEMLRKNTVEKREEEQRREEETESVRSDETHRELEEARENNKILQGTLWPK